LSTAPVASPLASSGPGDAEAKDGDDATTPSDSGLRAEFEALKRELASLRSQQPAAAAPSPVPSYSLQSAVNATVAPPAAGITLADLATITRALQDGQAANTAQMLLLSALGDLPTFNGKAADTTLAATEWLQRAEDFFAAREQALRIDAAAGDRARVLNATTALVDDARRWFAALPTRPASWNEFVKAVRARYCSVPDKRIRVDRLCEFVEKASKLRDKLNVQGMQAYAARFQQLAGEVPDDYVTLHGKIALLARGLPTRYAEVVMKEDAHDPPTPLHKVIEIVLSRAANKEHAVTYGGGAPAASASAAPMQLDAIQLAAAAFGWSREEAIKNFDDSNAEGWAPHDTSSSSHFAGPSNGRGDTAKAFSDSQMAQLASMFGGRRDDANPPAKNQSQRRNMPPDVRQTVPAQLAEARKAAGLCVKCGVTKYEPGGRGHNSRTCKLPADLTTSAADGKKKADF
jgi:alkylated DNA nucleotide flippase Atl1